VILTITDNSYMSRYFVAIYKEVKTGLILPNKTEAFKGTIITDFYC
jgi:hypothetical protein